MNHILLFFLIFNIVLLFVKCYYLLFIMELTFEYTILFRPLTFVKTDWSFRHFVKLMTQEHLM